MAVHESFVRRVDQLVLLKYELLTTVPCIISNTVSPTPRNLSATDLTVGSAIPEVSGLGRGVRSESCDNDVYH